MLRLTVNKGMALIVVLLLFSIFIIYRKIDTIDNKSNLESRIGRVRNRINKLEKSLRKDGTTPVPMPKANSDERSNFDHQNLPDIGALFEPDLVNNQIPAVNPNPGGPIQQKKANKLLESRSSDIEMNNLYEKIKYSDEDGGVWKQGWPYAAEKPNGDPLLIFVTPHSHQDPGWIYTFEEYFNQQTKPSLDQTVEFLNAHPDAKFIYAEISFFSMWWNSASDTHKEMVRKLVKDNQFEFVTGGWVMNDEANTHAYAMIDQLTEGHHWLLENLGYRPRSGWQIDPFGHSNTMGYIARKANLTHILIQRTHYEVKKELALHKNLEFNWVQSWDKFGKSSVFCHMMPFYSYDVPHTCGPDPSICCQFDFLRMSTFGCPWHISPVPINDQNVKERSETLLDQYYKKAMLYNNHNVLFVPLGDDFRYRFSNEWSVQYENYKRIMGHINSHKELYNTEIKFGTLTDYFEAVEKRSGPKDSAINFPTLQGDMFTYADRVKDYWSGYYTSRPLHKRLTRLVEAQVRTADILYSFGHLQALNDEVHEIFSQLTLARRNLGLFQHHDGITGTEKPNVAQDYENKLKLAIEAANTVQKKAVEWILGPKVPGISIQVVNNIYNNKVFSDVHKLLINDTSTVQEIALFNPNIIWPGNETVSFRIQFTENMNVSPLKPVLRFKDDPGLEIPVQFEMVQPRIMDVTFKVSYPRVKGLSFKGLLLSFKEDSTSSKPVIQDEKFILHNNRIELQFNTQTGLLEKMVNLKTGVAKKLSINFEIFSSSMSGAYLFLPDHETTTKYEWTSPTIKFMKGEIYDEIQVSDEKITHRVILHKYSDQDDFEIDNSVHLNSGFGSSIELVMSITSEIENGKEIHTDSNCYQMMRRAYIEKIPLQGNVYPMPCSSFIQGTSPKTSTPERMTFLTSHPIGVLTPANGVVMLWLDRKSFNDDNRGLFLGINDNPRVYNKIRVIFETFDEQILDKKLIPSHSKMVMSSIEKLLNPLHVYGVDCGTGECLKGDTPLTTSQVAKISPAYRLLNLKTYHSSNPDLKNFSTKKDSQIGLVLQKTFHYDNSDDNISKISINSLLGEVLKVVGYTKSSITLIPDPSEPMIKTTQDIELDPYEVQGYLLTLN